MADRTELAEQLALLPGVPEQLIERHTADGSGTCRGCQLPQTGRTRWPCSRWPCSLRLIATAANRR